MEHSLRITIIYDNISAAKRIHREGLKADWGFACLVEFPGTPKILFDTGANGRILFSNMKKLGIDPKSIEEVFISHAHWDHTGGLTDLRKENKNVKIYVPSSFSARGVKNVESVQDALEIHPNVFSTGELMGIEQSMAVKTEKGLVVIAGCSHPGVGNIFKAASQYGQVRAIIGGLHGFREFDLLKNLDLVCACHCTQFQDEIKSLYPEKWVEGGAGRVIEI